MAFFNGDETISESDELHAKMQSIEQKLLALGPASGSAEQCRRNSILFASGSKTPRAACHEFVRHLLHQAPAVDSQGVAHHSQTIRAALDHRFKLGFNPRELLTERLALERICFNALG